MISRNTFCDVLDNIKEYHTTYGQSHSRADCEDYAVCDYSLWDAESTVLALLSESLNDYDNLVSDWVHDLLVMDDDGVCYMDVHIDGQSTQPFKIKTSGDLYDYLMLINCGGDEEVAEIRAYRTELLAQHDLPYIPGGVIL